MSHFPVMLKITAERLAEHGGSITAAVSAMLAPYQENNMGDCPRQYLAFTDEEDNHLKEYAEGTTTRIVTETGELLSPLDEKFRVPGTFGMSFGGPEGCSTHKPPAHLERREVPFKELYPAFEQFVAEYHGRKKRDEETGRYGYWENPKAKWDWYLIGGRWTGYFPVRQGVDPLLGLSGLMTPRAEQGHSDICLLSDLDRDEVARQTREGAEKFWANWEMYKRNEKPLREDGKPDVWFEDRVRGKALNIGLVQVIRDDGTGKEKAPDGWTAESRGWEKCPDERKTWLDALSPIDQHEFLRQYIECFCPITPYAALDNDGWHAAGEMGWWGVSSDTPDQAVTWAKEFFARFIKASAPDTTLVVVDCHI